MNEVQRIQSDLLVIREIVNSSKDVSTISAYNEHGAKTLLLAGASNFERRITESIKCHVNAATQSDALRHFTFYQAVDRKFFSLFSFSAEEKNINVFLSKFGPYYKQWAKDDLKSQGVDVDFQRAFLDFCRLRNSLVHNNYATFNINKTLDEIWSEFEKAQRLVNWIETSFSRFAATITPTTSTESI